MHILDKILKEKFFTEFEQILYPILEKEGINLFKGLFEKYYSDPIFRHTIKELKFRHHKRKIAQLQILAQKQNLEVEGKVFQIAREKIQIENFKGGPQLFNLYLSFICNDDPYSKNLLLNE